MTARPEARLERDVLAAVGRLQRTTHPTLVVYRNEVGSGFTGDIARIVCPACRALIARHRIVYGLGTGSPDLVGVVEGRAFGIELKSATGRVRPEQERWHEAARSRGVLVRVVRTVEEALGAIEEACS